jgi:hypothetical protein
MPRIILTADHAPSSRASVLLAESVHSVHLSSDHAAGQLIERLRWALADAEGLERPPAAPTAGSVKARAARERARRAA